MSDDAVNVARVEDVVLIQVTHMRALVPGWDKRRVEDTLCLNPAEAKTLYSQLGEVVHPGDVEECKLLRQQVAELRMEHKSLIQRLHAAHATERGDLKQTIDKWEQAADRCAADAKFYKDAYQHLRDEIGALLVVKP